MFLLPSSLQQPRTWVEKIHETVGWHIWAAAEVEAYRKHHVIGTEARWALKPFLGVGARISDVWRIGRMKPKAG